MKERLLVFRSLLFRFSMEAPACSVLSLVLHRIPQENSTDRRGFCGEIGRFDGSEAWRRSVLQHTPVRCTFTNEPVPLIVKILSHWADIFSKVFLLPVNSKFQVLQWVHSWHNLASGDGPEGINTFRKPTNRHVAIRLFNITNSVRKNQIEIFLFRFDRFIFYLAAAIPTVGKVLRVILRAVRICHF